jgi:hypothetical protein
MPRNIPRRSGPKGGRPRGPSAVLSQKHQQFVEEYAASGNATAAYRKVYPQSSPQSARANGTRLLANDRVAAAVAAAREARLERTRMDGDAALDGISTMARADIRQLFDDNGNFRDMREWPNEIAASVCSVKVLRTRSGDQIIDVKIADKLRAHEDMAKAGGKLTEKHEHTFKPLSSDDLKHLTDEQLKAAIEAARSIAARPDG